eukprot:Phypoly_transcript_02738.p1 GENE.Phypoly_transcript_02738~~Phypoly_transcript_02738.p1  ORF type:complete len:252 (-),score=37.39 Phypoly_transcript_02738:974-1729(-)
MIRNENYVTMAAKRQKTVELHSFVELYQALHSDHDQSIYNSTCWIMKGVGYAHAQIEVAKYLHFISKTTQESQAHPRPADLQPNIQCYNLQPSHLQPSDLQSSNPQTPDLLPANVQPSNILPSNLSNEQFSNSPSNPPPPPPTPPSTPPSNLPSNLQPSNLQPSNQQPSNQQPSFTTSTPSSLSIFEWDAYDLRNFKFWGCMIPPEIAQVMKSKGAEILESPSFLPFSAFRNSLYSQKELRAQDSSINHRN